MREKGVNVDNCGLDINENLIDLTKKKYHDAQFIALDIEDSHFDRMFDVIFICGVFNLRIAGIQATMKNVLKRLVTICRHELYINVLSTSTAHKDNELFSVKAEVLVEFSKHELSSHIELRDDLIDGDLFLSVSPRYDQ